jgi:hypothetical protein
MPTAEDRLTALEARMIVAETAAKRLAFFASAIQGGPAPATLSIPHNDSWLFEDNVDGTHPANLRYVISENVQRVVSARLSIKLGAYRTYSSFSATQTNLETTDHFHATPNHPHTMFTSDGINSGVGPNGEFYHSAGSENLQVQFANTNSATLHTDTSGGGTSGGRTAAHLHAISITSTLGVTEGTVATGIRISFDGVDQTVALGGPFNADVIELDVRPYLSLTLNTWHVIAMQPSGLGRIEAHLRLGVFVSAGQSF